MTRFDLLIASIGISVALLVYLLLKHFLTGGTPTWHYLTWKGRVKRGVHGLLAVFPAVAIGVVLHVNLRDTTAFVKGWGGLGALLWLFLILGVVAKLGEESPRR